MTGDRWQVTGDRFFLLCVALIVLNSFGVSATIRICREILFTMCFFVKNMLLTTCCLLRIFSKIRNTLLCHGIFIVNNIAWCHGAMVSWHVSTEVLWPGCQWCHRHKNDSKDKFYISFLREGRDIWSYLNGGKFSIIFVINSKNVKFIRSPLW